LRRVKMQERLQRPGELQEVPARNVHSMLP
jgi:hypothetical protein